MVGVEILRTGDGGVESLIDKVTVWIREELLLRGPDSERANEQDRAQRSQSSSIGGEMIVSKGNIRG